MFHPLPESSLRVLESTLAVVEQARLVRIHQNAVQTVADGLSGQPFKPPAWRIAPHYWGDEESTANFVLLLDALNFCFWGQPKWRVRYLDRWWDGYWALAAALHRAIDGGVPILDARWLARLQLPELQRVLAGEGELKLLGGRLSHAREIGTVLTERYGGSFASFVRMRGRGDAIRLVQAVIQEFPSFRDVAWYRPAGQPAEAAIEVRFYKRAQILASDLYGAFEGEGLGDLKRMEQITAFADYKVPQVLRELGLLSYEPALAASVDAMVELEPGSPAEIEIRASTVWGIEFLRAALAERGVHLRPFEVDWHLWTLAQELPNPRPYHRAITAAY